jgi:glucose/arabinose dehydrogenase
MAITALVLVGLAACGTRHAASLMVVAKGLENPRQLSFGPGGVLYVAEAGSGGSERCATVPDSGERVCIGASGSIVALRGDVVRRVISGLPSVAAAGGAESSGVADVVADDGKLAFVVQDTHINKSGENQFATAGADLGHLVVTSAKGGKLSLVADLARFEATHNPDHGAGASAADALESDPYGLAAYRGGYVVADAAANDLLWVTRSGQIHVLAVFPVRYETVHGKRVAAQSVPTSVAIGPDGAIYVGELTGYPFQPGTARIWRVMPGHSTRVFATGFTNITAIAFDHAGRLLVLEIDRDGLQDAKGSGALIRLDAAKQRTVLATRGLVSPTGVAVSPSGAIYISNHGTSAHAGEVVRLST